METQGISYEKSRAEIKKLKKEISDLKRQHRHTLSTKDDYIFDKEVDNEKLMAQLSHNEDLFREAKEEYQLNIDNLNTIVD